jgi:hypothetical protein
VKGNDKVLAIGDKAAILMISDLAEMRIRTCSELQMKWYSLLWYIGGGYVITALLQRENGVERNCKYLSVYG